MKRAVAIVVFNVVALVAIAAAYVVVRDWLWPVRVQKLGDDGFIRKSRLLGHRPAAGMQTSGMLKIGDRTVYDVTYTIDADGLRVSPPEPAGEDAPCVLFFGCSFMFGEGLEDDETLPYRVGVLSGGRYAVRNFGFSGYGPHHMLGAIEGGFVAEAARCQPRYAIYLGHYHHNLRAAGRWWWDRYGPRYILEDGVAVRYGNFHDPDVDLPWSAAKLEGPEPGAGDVTPENIHLLYGIVDRSRALLARSYPGIEFHVLYWDKGEWPLFGAGWDATRAPVHFVSDILRRPEDVEEWRHAYKLDGDDHPNALAGDGMARYVVREILGLEPAE